MIRSLILAFSAAFACVEGFAPGVRWVSFSPRTTTALSASNANELLPLKQGSSCAIVTPMLTTGDIDIAGLRTLLRYHVESGTDNLCILGTTGEASVLSMDERALVLKTAVEEVKGKIPILAGTGTIDPKHVKEMTLQAIDIGCDSSLVVTPYYVKPPQRCLVKHFISMADLGLPVVIYNIPGRAKIDFLPESIALCADHEKIVALKDATAMLERVGQMRDLIGNKLLLFSGDDNTSPDFVMLGGDGCISVTANVAPNAMHELMKAALKKDREEVERLNNPLKLLHQKLFLESSPIPVKWAVKRMGLIDSPYCRPPLDQLDPKYHSEVENALKAAGLIKPSLEELEAMFKQDVKQQLRNSTSQYAY